MPVDLIGSRKDFSGIVVEVERSVFGEKNCWLWFVELSDWVRLAASARCECPMRSGSVSAE